LLEIRQIEKKIQEKREKEVRNGLQSPKEWNLIH
jgi:hypothetical protein